MAKKGRKERRKAAQREAAGTPDSDQPVRVPETTPATVSAADEAVHVAAPGGARALSNAFIALFLLYQVVMPLRYYLGGRGYDERFSWRMFSTLRMQECTVHVDERVGDETRAVDLDKALQIAWIGMLQRYRRPVIDKLLQRRCGEQGVHDVSFARNCTDTDGSALPATQVKLDCASGRFEVQGDALANVKGAPP